MRHWVAAAAVAAALSVAVAAHAAPQPVVVTGDPAAPAVTTGPGQGLCMSSAQSMNAAADFGSTTAVTYNAVVNAFIEAHANDRVTAVQRTLLDLSNNNTTGLQLSYGDFTNSMSGCGFGGCGFPWNDTTTPFASRLRGYFNVTPAMANQPLHFGFYTDDAIGVIIYDKQQTTYTVVARPPQLGAPTWRTTNTVTFAQPGLYAIELLYVGIVEHSALELSFLQGAFVDFELPANQMGSTNLKQSGFQLALASQFYLTENGIPPFTDLDKCQQCNRQFANLPGNGDCGGGSGYYCNGAALCSPCNSSLFCGPSCSPCGQATPHCINKQAGFVCVQCRSDADCGGKLCVDNKCECRTSLFCGLACLPCPAGLPCVDDGMGNYKCAQCKDSSDCPRGQVCDNNKCEPCASASRCAGNSCNCCPVGQQCAATGSGLPTCVECTQDKDCPAGRTCDTVNGRCVQKIAECNTPDKCGDKCQKCPDTHPFCVAGKACAQCRNDLDCKVGSFCRTGECAPCTEDQRCGARCESCSGDKPFCKSDGTPERASCVRCKVDADCPGATCNVLEGVCSAACTMSCMPGLLCYGDKCVGCFASTHCPCGQRCDTSTLSCTTTCEQNSDCGSGEYCHENRCKPGTTKPADRAPCCTGSVGGRERNTNAAPLLAVLGVLGLMYLRARRGRSRRVVR